MNWFGWIGFDNPHHMKQSVPNILLTQQQDDDDATTTAFLSFTSLYLNLFQLGDISLLFKKNFTEDE
jgi:hypothetical protein